MFNPAERHRGGRWHPGGVDEPRVQVGRRSIGDSFAGFCAAVVRRLPFGLASVVAPSLVGFGLINGFTFGVDLALLTLLRTGLGWPVWAAISVSYVTAFGLSFVLNRWLNFRSHAPAGRQTGLYLVTITINYLAILLGVGGGLATLGVQYHLSRIIAGVCEAAFMYCALRWVVFADRAPARSSGLR